MLRSTHLTSIVHLLVGTLTLALILRTWFVMGLIEPVTVAGSSMAPTLLGPHIAVQCARCGYRFEIGAEFGTESTECLRCGYAKNSVEGLPIHPGDHLVVDRLAFELRAPRRWEPVAFRSPEDGHLTVKRVVGLPGETVQLRDGDVWIGGRVAKKSLTEMRAMRQLIHEESQVVRRWQPSDESKCRWHTGAWHIAALDNQSHGIRYEHPAAAAITSESAYNAGVTQHLFPISDFAISTEIHSPADWQLEIGLTHGSKELFWGLTGSGAALLEVFAFDRQVQIYRDGILLAETDLDPATSLQPTASPIYLAVWQSYVELRKLRLYRDLYHASESEVSGRPLPMNPVELGPAEIYVLGDNPPVSIDSRRWGPLPLRLLVGRPVGAR